MIASKLEIVLPFIRIKQTEKIFPFNDKFIIKINSSDSY